MRANQVSRAGSSAHRTARRRLDRLYRRYDARYLSPDPLEFPRRFAKTADRELVGLVASGLAYGNVKAICRSMETVLEWMGPSPSAFVGAMDARSALKSLSPFQHRWSRARDVVCLASFIAQMVDRHGSVGGFFQRTYEPGDMASSIGRFSEAALTLDHGGLYRARALPPRAGVRYFFTKPTTGACKRMNMFLRWMVRKDDGLDFGIWNFVDPKWLIMPLDTHIFRIARHLGWTQRKTQAWAAAQDITSRLAEINPRDPVKYDFALSRMGIHEHCPRHRPQDECELCDLKKQ